MHFVKGHYCCPNFLAQPIRREEKFGPTSKLRDRLALPYANANLKPIRPSLASFYRLPNIWHTHTHTHTDRPKLSNLIAPSFLLPSLTQRHCTPLYAVTLPNQGAFRVHKTAPAERSNRLRRFRKFSFTFATWLEIVSFSFEASCSVASLAFFTWTRALTNFTLLHFPLLRLRSFLRLRSLMCNIGWEGARTTRATRATRATGATTTREIVNGEGEGGRWCDGIVGRNTELHRRHFCHFCFIKND
jgi:hypothetical protein